MKSHKALAIAKKILLVPAIIVAALCYMTWRGGQMLQERSAKTIAAEESDTEITRVSLSTHDLLSSDDGQTSVKLLRERLDNWLGAGSYDLDVQGLSVELSIPSSALEGTDPLGLLTKYVIRPAELYVCDGTYLGYIVYMEANGFHIARDDIEGVEIADGVPRKGAKSLVVTLEKEVADALAKATEGWEKDPIIWLDPGENPGYGFDNITFDSKKRTVSFAPNPEGDEWESQGQYYPLLAFALGQEGMPLVFNADIHKHVDWNAYDRIAHSKKGQLGKGRINPEEFNEPITTLEISYRAHEGEVTERDLNKLLDMLAARLDAMNVPYALGSCLEEEDKLMVRLPASHMGGPIRSLIQADDSYFVFQVGSDRFRVEKIDLVRGFGAPSLSCTVTDHDKTSLVDAVADCPDSPIYLGTYGAPLFVAKGADVTEDGSVTFRSACFDIAQDDPWLFDLADACANRTRIPADLSLTASEHADADAKMGITYESQLDELREVVLKSCPDAVAQIDASGAAVFLHLDVDETLPERYISAVQMFCDSYDLEHSVFDSVYFYACDTASGERASISVNRWTALGDEDDSRLYLRGAFLGGRLDAYRDDFEKRLRASNLWRDYYDEKRSSFWFTVEDTII